MLVCTCLVPVATVSMFVLACSMAAATEFMFTLISSAAEATVLIWDTVVSAPVFIWSEILFSSPDDVLRVPTLEFIFPIM